MEQTLILLKPDCLQRRLEKRILKRIKDAGITVVKEKEALLTKEEIEIVWENCIGLDFWEGFKKYLLEGRVKIIIVRADNAIERVNALVGEYDDTILERKSSYGYEKNTIRGTFATSEMRNVIHSSLNEEEFLKEVLLFF